MSKQRIRYAITNAAGLVVQVGTLEYDDEQAAFALVAMKANVPAGGAVRSVPDGTAHPAIGAVSAFPKL